VSVNAILDANDLQKETLVAGQKLFIPGATLSASELRRAMGNLFMLPVKGGRLTSTFGWRSDPFTGVRTFHTGIDLAAGIGTPIKASMEGSVATTGFSSVFGNYVILSHDSGYQTLYGHMSSIGVRRGQRVAQGAEIGKVGNTGYSTGSHCHFSVYKNGKMINPYSVIN
jgi:murein DD-endopeptidase MepM/ murein hydrolase activator NlpD